MKRRNFELNLGQIEQRLESLLAQVQKLEESREQILKLNEAAEKYVGKYWFLKDSNLQESPDYHIKVKDLDYSPENDTYVLAGPGYVSVYEEEGGVAQSTSSIFLEIPREMWKEWEDFEDNREIEETEFIADWKSFRSRMDTELRKWIRDEEEDAEE